MLVSELLKKFFKRVREHSKKSSGIEIPREMRHRNAPEGTINGFICYNADGKVIHCCSVDQTKEYRVSFEVYYNGVVEVKGKVYHLRALFSLGNDTYIALISPYYPALGRISILPLEKLESCSFRNS
jgi:hypothetical protein